MHVDLRHEKSRHEFLKPRQEGGRKWVRALLLVMIVTLVSWYFLGDSQPTGDSPSGLVEPPAAKSDASVAFRVPLAVRESEKPSPAPPSSTAVVGGGRQAREMIGNLREQGKKINLDQVFRRAKQFENERMLEDAYLMYFFAATQGHADSAMVLGTMYDPNHIQKSVGIIDEPDWGQAHKWYLKAVEGGNSAARKRLESLRRQVENAADKGDVEAARVVLQWR
uniref:Sel1 repeat-containing protein n=1 Tax=Candidatus Kentrum sp. SD TaxID=2126332 RepID=A0A450YAK2_9GAMM|nr:MAG: hypothetical protein BECKSD772F_GA0070984_102527 [Candidatus Kentron sp. SD]VFK48284.1 MAG: hypothetical protein BECKSD772E_GA0070983_11198 [Candidatus Kentron sp. SD]VFK80421.1 MAG: hypothetical protein BECKSD772D_GA0070982_11133 [Candidatus Kentron sp. SD]